MTVLGEGAYGCVHKPSLKCKDKPNKNYDNKVSKVLRDTESIGELSEYKNIDKS